MEGFPKNRKIEKDETADPDILVPETDSEGTRAEWREKLKQLIESDSHSIENEPKEQNEDPEEYNPEEAHITREGIVERIKAFLKA